MIEFIPSEQDDPQYIEAVQSIVNGATKTYQPAGVYVVKIKGWFDHKWLGFSGKEGGQAVWKPALTVPPFHPHRVLSQKSYAWIPDIQDYAKFDWSGRLHGYQPSSQNLVREIRYRKQSVIYIWYSSDTMQAGRGSLMVYVYTRRDRTAWFVSLAGAEQWSQYQAKNIAIEQINSLRSIGERLRVEGTQVREGSLIS